MLSHPAHLIALGFGAGLAPMAPGTFGTLVAVPIFRWIDPRLPATGFLALLAVLYAAGIWVCGYTARALAMEDPKCVVWDEIVAFLLVLFFTPRVLMWQVGAFVLFRLFDALKPGPVRHVEARFRGGFGVMVDDVVAAFLTLILLTLVKLALDYYVGG
jgi:phosphatidylglycerophosphatase A